jgi:hypothetical protein
VAPEAEVTAVAAVPYPAEVTFEKNDSEVDTGLGSASWGPFFNQFRP